MSHAASGRREKYYTLRERLLSFAVRVIKLYRVLPRDGVCQVIGREVLRSATSVGAQFTEGFRAKSNADFISKLEGAMQELEESIYWLDLLVASESMSSERLAPLRGEANEIMAILVTAVRTVKAQKR